MHEAGMLTAQPQHCIQSSWIMTVYIVGQQKLPSVTLLWTRCGHDTTSSCFYVLINSSASLHNPIERYIDSCVASNIQHVYVGNQLQFVMFLAAWSQELFSNYVIVMADNDVVKILHFEPWNKSFSLCDSYVIMCVSIPVESTLASERQCRPIFETER
jgi:hypothetical protein